MHQKESEKYKEAYEMLRKQLVQMHQGLEKGQKKYKTWQKQVDEVLINADHVVTQRLYVLRHIGFTPYYCLISGGTGDLDQAEVFTEHEATAARGYGATWQLLSEAREEWEAYEKKKLDSMPPGPGGRSSD